MANVSQLLSIDRTLLTDRVGQLSAGDLQLVLAGVDLVLGREYGSVSTRTRSLPPLRRRGAAGTGG